MQEQLNEKGERLTAKLLLARIYGTFAGLPGARLVQFSRIIFSVIARDLDERGCAYYRGAVAVTIGRTNWILSLGTAEESPLASPFASDISAFPLRIPVEDASDESIIRFVTNRLANTESFKHSLLISMANGLIGMNYSDGVYQHSIFSILHDPAAIPFISTVYDRRGPYLLYRPPMSSRDHRYDPAFVPYLSRAFQRALEDDHRGL